MEVTIHSHFAVGEAARHSENKRSFMAFCRIKMLFSLTSFNQIDQNSEIVTQKSR
jgi:hypothetical protein